MNEAHDLSNGLLRQRRNLMLSSSVLLFLGLADAELNSIQILGFSASFGRPEAVVYGLVAVALYFLYRYWLYLIQEPGRGLRNEFYRRLNLSAKAKVIALRDLQYPDGANLEILEKLGARKSGKLSWTIMVVSGADGGGGNTSGDLEIFLKDVWQEAVKSVFMACIARSYFTDYVFPFLMATAAVAAGTGLVEF